MKEILHVPVSIRSWLDRKDTFAAMMHLQGQAYRDVKGRKTMQVKLGEHSYFIKQHFGIGWAEIFKNLLSCKQPVLGAMTEVSAIQALNALGIPTTPLVAYGQRGRSPARLQSFVMTEDLGEIVSLEELCATWHAQPPTPEFKRALIIAVAELAAKLHASGLCHRDFYLCHFVLKKSEFEAGNLKLYLIDLHRMLQHQAQDGTAVLKDIAGLYFSAMECGLNAEDLSLFKTHYLPQRDVFWQQVCKRAKKLHAKFNSVKFQQRLHAEKAAIRDSD